MGILSGITAVATLGSSLFGSGKESSGGSPSKGTSTARAVFEAINTDMAASTSFFEKKRTEQRAETESRDPTTKIVANILSSENKREPKLEEYFKRLA
jgi:hypothetical protein|tara:strand:+ start:307 stop:600 length:294 start_codon:yes stop_codon:yes gene_type:complete